MNQDKIIKLMTSSDYKDRFIAEYHELKNRSEKLEVMLTKLKNGELHFIADCPEALLGHQLVVMKQYLRVLEQRAQYENINLEEEN